MCPAVSQLARVAPLSAVSRLFGELELLMDRLSLFGDRAAQEERRRSISSNIWMVRGGRLIEGGGVLSHGICQRPTTVRGVSFMCSSSISSRWRRRTGPLDGRDRVPGEGLCHCFSSAPRRRHTSVVARRVGANLAAHPSVPSTPSRGFDRRSARANFASDFEQCAVYRNLFLFDEYSFIVRIQASHRSVSCPPLLALVRRRAHSRLSCLGVSVTDFCLLKAILKTNPLRFPPFFTSSSYLFHFTVTILFVSRY